MLKKCMASISCWISPCYWISCLVSCYEVKEIATTGVLLLIHSKIFIAWLVYYMIFLILLYSLTEMKFCTKVDKSFRNILNSGSFKISTTRNHDHSCPCFSVIVPDLNREPYFWFYSFRIWFKISIMGWFLWIIFPA